MGVMKILSKGVSCARWSAGTCAELPGVRWGYDF